MSVSSDEISVPSTFDGTSAPRIDTESLSRLITMAVRSAGADIGGISMVHRDHIWMPVRVGHLYDLLPRSGSFCGAAVDSGLEWFEVEDAKDDECFRTHRLVTGVPTFRHYAAVPIHIASIRLQGTVWVMWQSPGIATAEQRDTLSLLAGLVIGTLELRYCDEVTGIVNHSFFMHSLQRIVETTKVELTVGYINLRSFSRFNAVYGKRPADPPSIGRQLCVEFANGSSESILLFGQVGSLSSVSASQRAGSRPLSLAVANKL